MAIEKPAQFVSKGITAIFYCLLLLCATAYSIKKPAYNWDMLPYMGIVLLYDGMDAKTVHQQVYAIAKNQVPATYYNRMVDPSNNYRSSVAQSATIFQTQLPFYIVKPLYTRIVWLFYKTGIALPLATILPSAIAYFFTGLLLFLWLSKYWPALKAGIAGILIMLSPPLLSTAGLSTPDAFSGLLILTAIFYLVEKKSFSGTLFFLLLAVFTRLDNILPAFFFLSLIFFTNKWNNPISPIKIVLAFTLLLTAYFAVSWNVSTFGWSVFFYPAFIKQLNSSYIANSNFNFSAYLSLAKTQIITGLYFSFVSIFFLLVLLLTWNSARARFNMLTLEQTLAITFIIIMAVRFLLQPLITDRIYIPYYLAVILFLVKQNSPAINRQ